MAQGKITPLIAAMHADDRAIMDLRIAVLVADMRAMGQRLDAISAELQTYIAQLQANRGAP